MKLSTSLICCIALFGLAACTEPARRTVVVQSPGQAQFNKHSQGPGGTYQVVKGDTLYAIAFRNNVDFRELAGWNHIPPPYTIHPGQTLKLGASSDAEPVAPSSALGATAGAMAVAPSNKSAESPSRAIVPAGAASTAEPATTSMVPVAGSTTGTTAPAAASTPVTDSPSRAADGIHWRWPSDGKLAKGFQKTDPVPGLELTGNAGDPVRAAADGLVVYSGNGLVGYGELIIIKHNENYLSAYGHNRKRLVKEAQRVSAGQQIAEMGDTGASHVELQFQIRRDGTPVDPLDYLPKR